MIDYRLYLITDDPSRYAGDWLDNVVAAVEGGVTCVQYRDTESIPRERWMRARRLHEVLQSRATPLVINNDASLAACLHAEGVHVGQGDMPPNEVRAVVGPACEIGYSIPSRACVRPEQLSFCQSVGIGPVFDARKTKADAADAMGMAGLSDVVSQLAETFPQLATVAIGGITLENAAEVLASGVTGLALVSAFSKAEDSYESAKRFSMLFDHRRV